MGDDTGFRRIGRDFAAFVYRNDKLAVGSISGKRKLTATFERRQIKPLDCQNRHWRARHCIAEREYGPIVPDHFWINHIGPWSIRQFVGKIWRYVEGVDD